MPSLFYWPHPPLLRTTKNRHGTISSLLYFQREPTRKKVGSSQAAVGKGSTQGMGSNMIIE